MNKMTEIAKNMPYNNCRKFQESLLHSLVRETGPVSPSLFVYGHSATGKTICIKNVLNQRKVRYVFCHCVELYTPRLLFEHILLSITSRYQKCDDVNSFIRLLSSVMTSNETIYLVFERAERMRTMPANIIPALLRLSELVSPNVSVVLESRLPWENFRNFTTGCQEPITIHFTEYSKDDLVEILSLARPSDDSHEFYTAYCSLIVNVFFSATRDLRELGYLTRMNYAGYKQPVLDNQIGADNERALWKSVEPQLRTAMTSVFLHEVSNRQWNADKTEDAVKLTDQHIRESVELPFFSKYLLLSAYLASYNPVHSDKRFFLKNAGKIKKRAQIKKKSQRTGNLVLGPKPFQLDRLMAIFYSIVEGSVQPTTHIHTQISNLVALQLLATVGSDTQFDAPKYKCLINLEFAKSIARTVHFDLLHYIYELN